MPDATTSRSVPRTALRLWPGVLLVAVQWLIRFLVPVVAPDAAMVAVIGGIAGGAAVLVWGLFFSRARWAERLGALVGMAGVLFAASYVVPQAVAEGVMGVVLPTLPAPILRPPPVGWGGANPK